MRDPLDELKNLYGATGEPPLPSADVRRRGDRMRRRRMAFQALGVAAAVLAVVSGGALVTGDLNGSTPSPGPATQSPSQGPQSTAPPSGGPAPPGGWLTEIPAGFALGDGLPEPDGEAGPVKLDGDSRSPWVLDPCRERPEVELRADYLGITQRVPAGFHQRQLAVYWDDETAAEVMAGFAEELQRCPNQQNLDEPGGGFTEDVWTEYGGDLDSGDESFTIVRHLEQSGMRMTPAVHYAAVRVGNAVLVSAYGAEFGASQPEQIKQALEGPSAAVAAIADRMCVFATDPCAQPVEGVDAPEAADAVPGYVLDVETLRDVTGLERWQPVDDSEWGGILCAKDSTEALAGNRTDTSRFAVLTHGKVRATAIVQVLGFTPSTWRSAGYETAAGWLASCVDTVDDSHRIVSAGEAYGPLHTGESAHGPMSWRSVMSSAPEICEECDAAWNNHQGVALTPRRLVLVQVSYAGDMQGSVDESGSPMPELLRAAAKAASDR